MKHFVGFDIDVLKYSVMDECILTDIEYDRLMTEILQYIGCIPSWGGQFKVCGLRNHDCGYSLAVWRPNVNSWDFWINCM